MTYFRPVQFGLFGFLLLTVSGCGGPFRPPRFDSTVSLSSDRGHCVTTIHGTWPNLPDNPVQWFIGGRTNLVVSVSFPNSEGVHPASDITVYYTWSTSAPYLLKGLSGRVEFRGNAFVADLSQTLDGSTKRLELSGSYIISNPQGCS